MVRFAPLWDDRDTCSGEDVVSLLLHQHRHVFNVATPQVQTVLHAFYLTGTNKTQFCQFFLILRKKEKKKKRAPTCCRSSTLGCTQVICTFWSTSSMFPFIRPTDSAFITSSSTCRRHTCKDSSLTLPDSVCVTKGIANRWPS